MRAIEFTTSETELDEMAGKVHGDVRKALKDKGYKYLGKGIDKQAFLEPSTGQVLVIFGYSRWYKGKFSPDQLMFVRWAKYCQENQDKNPHLPRFSGWESFEFKGHRYLQIRMEPLKKLPEGTSSVLYWLDKYVNEKGKIDTINVAQQINDHEPLTTKANEIIEYLGGAKAASGLMKTVQVAKRMAEKERVTLDLHMGNYMQRSDGTIVVNDPFVATFF